MILSDFCVNVGLVEILELLDGLVKRDLVLRSANRDICSCGWDGTQVRP